MKPHMETHKFPTPGNISPPRFCKHGRLIDDVLTKEGKRTGQVRCLECLAIFDEPYQSLK